MRQRFGEFFFRVVVLDYFKNAEHTILVSLAVLLNKNQYNMVDVDAVFKGCADQNRFADWVFTQDDYVVTG